MARYIDADALPIVTECCVDEAGFFAKFKVVHEDDIKNAPTIEARPVVRGEWLGERGSYICSNCGGDAPDESYWPSPFCAACGAEMRGDDDGET